MQLPTDLMTLDPQFLRCKVNDLTSLSYRAIAGKPVTHTSVDRQTDGHTELSKP